LTGVRQATGGAAAGEAGWCADRGGLDLSVILPAFNEEDSIGPLYQATVAAVAPLGLAFEIVLVDDGSKDKTFERCAALAAADPRVRVIKFRRNCGQTAAMAAGIEHASGAILVTMDADLQNDPADIPRLLAKLREGYDLVVGWRHQRQDRLLSRRLPSVIANRLIARVTGVDIKDNGCSLKAYRADLIKRVPLYAEMHRFIPAMSSLAIKTLLLFAARPLFCFVGSAAVAGALSLLCALFAVYHATTSAGSSIVVFMSVSIMLGALSLFLVLIGLIGFLIYQTASEGWTLQPFQLLERSTARAEPRPGGGAPI
jgi:glycosyltransferase involved in cell wall biosynthesis